MIVITVFLSVLYCSLRNVDITKDLSFYYYIVYIGANLLYVKVLLKCIY